MRQAGAAYLQEEERFRGAKPRVKAVLSPFELDYGLSPGSGEFIQTIYGGEPGSLALAGDFTSGSWTSPIIQAFSPYLDEAVTYWETPAEHINVEIGLRVGATPNDLTQKPFTPLVTGQDLSLGPYFQVSVTLQETIPVSEGRVGLAGFNLAGRLTLPEQEIIDPGSLQIELARDFSELRAADHTLVLDNRLAQWLNRPDNPSLQGLDLTQKQLSLCHGWELTDGTVAWQELYRGAVQRLSGVGHGWRQQHRVRLESQDRVAAALKQMVGPPTSSGERQPFMRGTYLASGEMVEVIPATTSEIVRTGSGSAWLNLLGTYRGDLSQDYVIEVEATGELGIAFFRWSHDGGQSWEKTGLVARGPDAPMQLEDGLSVYWESGVGQDLVAGDRWSFSAIPPVYCYQVFGAPFRSISVVYLDGEIDDDRVIADADTGLIRVTGKNAQVQARLVKDNTTHPVDILTDILAEVGLSLAIHRDSFALAKSLTPEYAIGVRFENISASQAIREIVRRCLYDLWIDFGEIKIEAYLGEQ